MNEMLRFGWSKGLSVILIAAFGAGCSVMQIDVDVYKGPLANHKDVQTEQLAVMAVGAEPLLKRLEMNLVEAIGDQGDPLIENVKDILSLYKDRDKLSDAGAVINLLELTESDAQRIVRNVEILDGDKISGKFKTLMEEINSVIESQDTEPEVRALAEAYKEFLTPLSETKKSVRPYWIPLKKLEAYQGKFIRSNQAYRDFQDTAFLAEQAAIVFPGQGEEADIAAKRTLFVNEIARIAKAFHNSREALSDLFLHYTELLSIIPSTSFDTLENKGKAIDLVAARIKEIVTPLHLLFALTDANLNPDYLDVRQQFLAALSNDERTSVLASTVTGQMTLKEDRKSALTPTQEQGIRDILARLLTNYPERTSLALLEAHNDFIERPPTSYSVATAGFRKRYSLDDKIVRAYGLSGGLSKNREDGDEDTWRKEANTIERENRKVRKTIERSVRSFYRGRINDGLYTVIEEYLRSSHGQLKGPCEDDKPCMGSELTDTDYKREILFSVLVRFAQKVLFVVNHERLFTVFGSGKNTEPATKTYIQVLQTVGNSILVHVDAMRQMAAQEEGLRQAQGREAAGIKQAFGGGPGDMFSRIVASLRSSIEVTTRIVSRLDMSLKEGKPEIEKLEGELAAAQTEAQLADAELDKSKLPKNYKQSFERFRAARTVLGKNQTVKDEIDKLMKDDSIKPQDLYQKIKDKLNTALLNATDEEEQDQLRDAFDAFDKEKPGADLPDTLPDKKEERLKQIENFVNARLTTEEAKVDRLESKHSVAERRDKNARAAVEAKGTKVATAKGKEQGIRDQKAAAVKRLEELTTADNDTTEFRDRVLILLSHKIGYVVFE